MSKTLKVMFSLVVAFVLVLGLSTTAFAAQVPESPNTSYDPTPTPVIYYPNYNEVSEADEQEVPAATAVAPVSPKTGDNNMVVVVLVGAAVIATLGYAGVKALRA